MHPIGAFAFMSHVGQLEFARYEQETKNRASACVLINRRFSPVIARTIIAFLPPIFNLFETL